MPEIVYIFENEAMPNLIKIGKTSRDDIQQRLDELYNSHTGVALPFTCLYKVAVEDGKKVEDALHIAFDGDRINPRREFFKTPPHRVIALLKAFALPDQSTIAQEEVATSTSPEEMHAVDRAAEENARRSNFKFSAVNIPVGAELVYAYDDGKRCEVVDEGNKVKYDEVVYTLSGLALKFRREAGSRTMGVQGALHFLYEGELLSERRDRMEAAE